MTYDLFPDLRPPWAPSRDCRDWFELFREAEAEAELAAEDVRAANVAYRAARNAETEAAYRAADRRYDAARFRFQTESCHIVRGIKAIAGIARAMELASAEKERMV